MQQTSFEGILVDQAPKPNEPLSIEKEDAESAGAVVQLESLLANLMTERRE